VAKKAPNQQGGDDTLGSIAENLGSLLGNAEKQWRAWQGPRDAVVKAVTDVRDRAVALLSEMDVANLGADKGTKKDKNGKKGKTGKKKDAAKAEKKADKADKKAGKRDKKAGKRDKKAGKKARQQADAPVDLPQP
jgi:hypothetical protein